MSTAELQAAEDDLAEQLQQHSEALQGVREALQADQGDVELVQVPHADGTIFTRLACLLAAWLTHSLLDPSDAVHKSLSGHILSCPADVAVTPIRSRYHMQAEAELAAAAAEIEATLLELKRERLLAQLGGSIAGDDNAAAPGDAYAVTGSATALPAPGHSGMQPSSAGTHSDIHIGEEGSVPARLLSLSVSAWCANSSYCFQSSPGLLHGWSGLHHSCGLSGIGNMCACVCPRRQIQVPFH
jgi:hypothetical protein